QDAVHDAARNLERDVVNGDMVPELLEQPTNNERMLHTAPDLSALPPELPAELPPELQTELPSKPITARSSTAMRIATPQLTCCRITARGPSATCGASSTPRLIGPGCITIASGLAKPSVRSLSPNVRDSSRVLGNLGASPSNRSCWIRSIITTSTPSRPSSSR